MSVKVLATLGPSSIHRATELAEAGADGFRINLSHGDKNTWDTMVRNVRTAEAGVSRPLALIADLEGPRVRLGSFKPLRIKPGQIVVLGEGGIPVDRREFFEAVEPEDMVLIADGKVKMEVIEADNGRASARVVAGEVIEPRKGVAIAGKDLPLPPLTGKDLRDLDYIASRDFSHVMVSYVRDSGHVSRIRSELRSRGAGHIRVIAKIETPSGVKNIGEIAAESDGIVIARGDLGMHYPLEEIPRIQAKIIDETRRRFKPVILATELLSSMIHNPVPSRSDVVDVYMGVRSGVDALLLTNETATGKYPVEAVSWTVRIINSALRDYKPHKPSPEGAEYRLARGLVDLADSLDATLVVYSRTGTFPARVSAFRPSKPYWVGVPTRTAARAVVVLWGARPVIVPARDYEEGLKSTVDRLGPVLNGSIVMAAWSREQDYYRVIVKLDRGAS